MKKLLALLVLAVACATTVPSAASPVVEMRRESPLQRLVANTVTLETDDGDTYCSGVITDHVILTAAHCVEGRTSVRIGRHHETFRAYVVQLDLDQDVAVLATLGHPLGKGVPISGTSPEMGDDIWVLGHAMGEFEYTLTKGIVSYARRVDGLTPEMVWMQVDANWIGGNSGGPVVNARGQLVGLASFTVLSGSICAFDCAGIYDTTHIHGAIHLESINAILSR